MLEFIPQNQDDCVFKITMLCSWGILHTRTHKGKHTNFKCSCMQDQQANVQQQIVQANAELENLQVWMVSASAYTMHEISTLIRSQDKP